MQRYSATVVETRVTELFVDAEGQVEAEQAAIEIAQGLPAPDSIQTEVYVAPHAKLLLFNGGE